jgi:large subunit ribosomal protein L21
MYAVIKTGGKQYRVQPGDVLVVEKLQGEPGDEIRFDQVLMVGDEAGAVVGAPTVDGAAVTATLVETRKGEKVKIFKKIRRQGYRRTKGHRQPETVLRVISLKGAGKSAAWDGAVDLTPRATLVARSRGLVPNVGAGVHSAEAVTPERVAALDVVEDVAGPVVHATVVEHADPVVTEEAKPAKKAKAKKAEAATEEAPAAEAAAPEAEAAPAADAAPKKPRAKKKTDDDAPEGGEA